MTIRAFRESDFDAIAETYAQSKLDELCFEADLFELLPLEEDNKRLRETMESRIFVYDEDGILGYGAVHKNEIRALFVRPLFRGQGIGQRLLNHLMTQVEYPTRLYVAKSNAPAKAIYKKYGFIITREFETSYNGKTVLANEMIKRSGHNLNGVVYEY